MAHQAILIREVNANGDDLGHNESITNEIAKEFENEPFIGPNSITVSQNSERIYFTDSGPWGETSIQEAKVKYV